MMNKTQIGGYIKLIADNMIKTRPKKDVIYRPFLAQKGIVNLRGLYFDRIDFGEYYPGAKCGDYVWLRVGMTCERPQEIVVTAAGRAQLFYHGEQVLAVDNPNPDEFKYAPVMLDAGINELLIKCTAGEDDFVLYFLTALGLFKKMKARDYLFHTRTVIARGEYCGEEGYEISRLYHADEVVDMPEFVLPRPSEECTAVDFSGLSQSDRFGCALTYAVDDGVLVIDKEVDGIYINRRPLAQKSGRIELEKGDEVLVTCSDMSGFGFGTDCIGIPFLTSQRSHTTGWLLMTLPEKADIVNNISFNLPQRIGGEYRFWRFCDGSYLRAYMETGFFGQWFYALMVGCYGLLRVSDSCGEEYRDYFCDNMKILADYFRYAQYDGAITGEPSMLQRSMHLDNLDAIGTMGMDMIEYYNLTGDENALDVIGALEEAIMTAIERFSDGTFHRETTMWADDTYMSCPFLARLGVLRGDDRYFDECAAQLEGFYNKLFSKDAGLFSHIYFIEDNQSSGVFWGRGNGWVMLSLTEVLELMPTSHPKRARLIEMLVEFADGVKRVQDESGMWHQVMDMPGTYEETSCTGMFALSMLRGVKNGWLDKGFMYTAERAIGAILMKKTDTEGNIDGVCMGSGCSYDPQYYAKLNTVKNDDHGTGIILAALAEYADIK